MKNVYYAMTCMLVLINIACKKEYDEMSVYKNVSNQKQVSNIYILVHGAWHPASVWGKVKDKLEQKGHVVETVQLAGLGNDTTPLAQINLQTHVDSVVARINRQSGSVILVGHSYGGMVISRVGELLPTKIDKLVYVAAFMPISGESLIDLAVQDSLSVVTQNITINYPAITIPSQYIKEAFYNYSLQNNNQPLQNEIDTIIPLLRPHPVQTLLDTVILGSNFASLSKYYVECPDDQAITPYLQQMMYNRYPNTQVHTINNSDHSPFITRPNQLANYLKGL